MLIYIKLHHIKRNLQFCNTWCLKIKCKKIKIYTGIMKSCQQWLLPRFEETTTHHSFLADPNTHTHTHTHTPVSHIHIMILSTIHNMHKLTFSTGVQVTLQYFNKRLYTLCLAGDDTCSLTRPSSRFILRTSSSIPSS